MITLMVSKICGFRSEERGTVSIIFGLVFTTILFMAGMAVDYGRILDMRSRVAQSMDAASLAAGRALVDGQLADAEIIELAKTYFNKNVDAARSLGVIKEPNVSVDRESGSVKIGVDAYVNMTITRLGGFDKVDVPVESEAIFHQRDIEVGVALDITGSMNERVGGTIKIAALKSAFETFADRLYPQHPGSQRVRIGLAPYSASVNLGPYAGIVSNGKSKDGCVIERKDGSFTDNATSPFAVKADATKSLGSYYCPRYDVLPITEDKDKVVDTVKQLTAWGGTAGHLGAQWAWNLVSDKWATTWGPDGAPDSYQRVVDGKLIKAVVLMTDGEFNTSYRGGTSPAQALALCTAMKAEGILVFSVGFGLGGNTTAINTLQNCATPGPGYFADANSAEELEEAFSKFAGTLTALRLAK